MKIKLVIYKLAYKIVSLIHAISFRKIFTAKKIFIGLAILSISNSFSSCRTHNPPRTCYKPAIPDYEISDTTKNPAPENEEKL
ncbi:MAG: hypothetical protein A2W91_17700 [Bacteroidetes bacterium GWF2_38_335]|nr:MAG: hypothetical protein A2W91_17700 [Bacteroidetes bacterium GWF2_38_335]OFY78031.1 MAG: hypothetical protein A2281_18760 [Bacteroidetes bacterium RIFOXYA12_FULL_38_20]HBS88303.1 hypothetical protein [Bacteroidales bacterium]